jgi:hypothetical protein
VLTADGWTEIAYRCSKSGHEFVGKMPKKLKTQVDAVVRDWTGAGEPMNVMIDGNCVYLRSESGFERHTTVMDIGKIPFVLSPYLATCVRHEDVLLRDNSQRAYECVLWESEVPDDRDEAVVLANVSVILTEWMFSGPNSIGLLTESLEGSIYTTTARKSLTFTSLQVEGPITLNLKKKTKDQDETKCRATLLDFQQSEDVNFEAAILHSTDPPVKKIQEFGVHMNQNGVVMCGVQIEAMQDREWDDIAPNLLAGVLVELHHDSSIIIDAMLSKQQRDILRCLYDGNAASRTKSLCIVVDKIEPALKASDYMDGGRYQKEFVQLVGEVHTCRDMVSV